MLFKTINEIKNLWAPKTMQKPALKTEGDIYYISPSTDILEFFNSFQKAWSWTILVEYLV